MILKNWKNRENNETINIRNSVGVEWRGAKGAIAPSEVCLAPTM